MTASFDRYFLILMKPGGVQLIVIAVAVRYPNINMDVSENRGTPKWMVYNGKPS